MRGNKYHAAPTERRTASGAVLHFDSAKEARRYDELLLLRRAGEIRFLRLQVGLVLAEGYRDPDTGETIRPLIYRADFAYQERQPDGTWLEIVEDVKGVRTEAYKIKARLLRQRGIKVRET